MEWILRLLIIIDQFGNALTGGNPKAVISARVAYFANIKKTAFRPYWKILEQVINFAFFPVDGPSHCLSALEKDTELNYKHGSDIAKALLGLIIIVACIFIAIFLRIVILIIPSWHYKYKRKRSDNKKNKIDSDDNNFSQNS
ncbi:MAG: hypothetical protein ACC653_04210 [Gammaproteobacteria bacterium]